MWDMEMNPQAREPEVAPPAWTFRLTGFMVLQLPDVHYPYFPLMQVEYLTDRTL